MVVVQFSHFYIYIFCCCYAALTVSSISENDIVVSVIVDWYGCELKVGDGKCVNI